MVDDQIDRHLRVDLLGISAEMLHRIAHGGEVDHRRHAGKILHQHAGGTECDLAFGCFGLEPLGDRLDVILGHRTSVFVAQQVLQQHLHGEGQSRNALKSVSLGDGEAEVGVSLATNLEGFAASKTVERSHVGCFHSPAVDRRWFGLSYWQGDAFLAGEACVRCRIT
jgi:hypothetical protein